MYVYIYILYTDMYIELNHSRFWPLICVPDIQKPNMTSFLFSLKWVLSREDSLVTRRVLFHLLHSDLATSKYNIANAEHHGE